MDGVNFPIPVRKVTENGETYCVALTLIKDMHAEDSPIHPSNPEPIIFKTPRQYLAGCWRWASLLLFAGMSFQAGAFTDMAIYTDSLQSGWEDWSWNATRDFNSSGTVHFGSRSISVTMTAGWAALSLHHADLDTSTYTNLSFWIHGGPGGGQQLRVYAETSAAQPGVDLPPLAANTWQQINLSLASLQVANLPNVTRFSIQDRSGSAVPTFYVDDITLVGGATPPVASLIPAAGATMRTLSGIEVNFSEPVTGVDASDLLINGNPATNVTAYAAWQYVFEFPQPPTGTVQVAWAQNHGIADLAANPFPGGSWTYTLDPQAQTSAVEISEFMADNKKTIRDGDGDYSDWIEIFNPSAYDVNLSRWALTDDSANPTEWRFPNITLQANSYLVVFASGKDRTNATGELHTNFKLSVTGEFLALADPAGNLVSAFSPVFPSQQSDVSYGRDRALPDAVGYFIVPTPGEPNIATGSDASPAVQFSQPGGTFINPFNLQLSASTTNAVIRFTLDGTLPTDTSPVYNTVIPITGSVQVRSRSFTSGLLPGPIRSESYIQINPSGLNSTSDLPAIIIYNFGAGSVPVSTRQFVNLSFYEPQNGVVSLTNASTLSVRAGIHVRGSSTLWLPKQSWAVEFWDDFGDDQDFSPLGMPAESDWVLYAPNNFEPVLMHNPLAYQLSNEIGRYAPRTRFVEVYLNTTGGAVSSANYNGIYVLEEKIKWDNHRVDIHKLKPDENSPTNVTGGYLMKIDRLGTGETGFYAAGQTIAYVDPSEEDINTPQRAPQKQYIQEYLNSFDAALNGANYRDSTNGYRAYVDVDSWIDHHILNVVMFNVDALRLSAFFYKDRGSKLCFGPLWDFDRTQGSTDGRDFNPRIWRSPTWDYGTDFFNYPWWGRMFTDIDFWQQWIDRYQDLRTGLFSTNHIFADIDALAAQVRQEQPREAARWPSLTTPRSGVISVSGYGYTFPGTYQGEVDFLKQWYVQRLNFMDTNFLARPVFNNNGGGIPPGFALSMTGPAGATLYYTTNGSDPRLPGGNISPDARVYSSSIVIATNASILARAYDANHHNPTGTDNPPLSSPWSGLTAATLLTVTAPVILQSPVSLEAYVGQNPVFTVQAIGSPTPSYQWQFNGTNLVGQTNSQFALSSVQLTQTGVYSVVVSNVAGSTSLSFTLTVTPKPLLRVTEVMSSEATDTNNSTLDHQDWWELSNLDSFAVNLRGYRFDDNSASLSLACTITNDVWIAPGESVVLVENMSADAFRTWWGPQALPPNLKIITYTGSGLSLGSGGDAINVWNAVATGDSDKVASAVFAAAARGVSFGYNPDSSTFGGFSAAGENGAFIAAVNGDIGSPGTLINLPRFTAFSWNGTTFNLTLATQPGRHYRIEYTECLSAVDWLPLIDVATAPNPLPIIDPNAGNQSSRYYRAVMVP